MENQNRRGDFPYQARTIAWDRERSAGSAVSVMRRYENLRLLYVAAGTVVVRTLDGAEEIRAGEGMFINRNVVHSVDGTGTFHCGSFMFPAYFLKFYPGSPAEREVEDLLEREQFSFCVFRGGQEWQERALAVLKKLVTLTETGTTHYEYEVLVLLTTLWLEIQRNVSPAGRRRKNAAAARMKSFLYFIEQHYREEISLEELSASAGVSKSECLRCFKRSLGTTPYKYLMDYRLSKAADLLLNTDRQISEIAVMTGFEQPSYFGKCFRERLGCTPKEYRGGRFRKMEKTLKTSKKTVPKRVNI